jgi:5-methylcytosine-specific restriction endonuclease McrA
MSFGRTLVLDSTGQPVKIVDWQKAMILVLTNKAIVIDAYDNVVIRSASESYKLPSILQLFKRSRRKRDVNFSKKGVFYRDDFMCGYCGDKVKSEELTMDHIVPACQGGIKSWENIISACKECNLKKGGRTPEEAGMDLKWKPYRPNWNAAMFIQLKKSDPVEKWKDWIVVSKFDFRT